MIYPKRMVLFQSYVSLPNGIYTSMANSAESGFFWVVMICSTNIREAIGSTIPNFTILMGGINHQSIYGRFTIDLP